MSTKATHPLQLFQPNPDPWITWQPAMDLMEYHDCRAEDITKRVWVDVPNFQGKLDPHAFQDWIMSLEDYFGWYRLSPNTMMRLSR
jgi:hypothetical protein